MQLNTLGRAGVAGPVLATVHGDGTQEALALIRGRGGTATKLPDLSGARG